MKHNICVVTGSRAEYGLLRALILRLKAEDRVRLALVVTGSHLDAAFGNTVDEITADGLEIAARVPIPAVAAERADMAAAAGAALTAFAGYFRDNRPDMLVVLGDRYEIFAVAAAAAMQGIPIAHLHGGETTQGAVDEFLRHSITKMSWLHFTSCEVYRRRVIQLGEQPERVFNVGATGLENSLRMQLVPEAELRRELELDDKPYCVVTFHPVTLENSSATEQLYRLIRAMERFPQLSFVITKSNADAGGAELNRIWEHEAVTHPNWRVFASLGVKRYLSALKYARAMIGNSSSGIVEGPAMRIPTVNIGDRQLGRVMAESIVNCPPQTDEIAEAIERALGADMQATAAAVTSPYGSGDTSERITRILLSALDEGIPDTKKSFFDLDFAI